MKELSDESIHLVVTSPPYWHIKDYGVKGQIGYGQSLHDYLRDLYRVFKECHRVLCSGGKMCINIGDMFARSIVYGKYKVIPLHAEVIAMCEEIGFDYMGSIIWQKKTTMNTTGGAVVMGSFPYPPNGIIEIDYEFILIFKKEGQRKVDNKIKESSKLTKEEWKEYFSGHWKFSGARQINHEAIFPEELPRRLIKMFSFVGDTVLDPFAGSGTTLKVSLELGRKAVGYEINQSYLEIIKEKVGTLNLRVYVREEQIQIEPVDYRPKIKDAMFETNINLKIRKYKQLYKVVDILSEKELLLSDGRRITLGGIKVKEDKVLEAIDYLKRYVKGKYIFMRETTDGVKVLLKNRININKKMIQQGYAEEINEEK